MKGTTIGVIKGYTRSLDYSSHDSGCKGLGVQGLGFGAFGLGFKDLGV